MLKTEETQEMRDIVFQIAKALVDAPDEVTLDVLERDGSAILRLRVAPTDTGKIIGKMGRTARSIRTILAACGMKYHHRFSLEIIEDHNQQPADHADSLAAAN
jgi:hypothetical protein